MSRISTIELFKEDMTFSSGHFAIFSSQVRENLHGHNYNVHVSYTTIIEEEGLSFDYRFYKDKLRELCDTLNEIVLMPGHCMHLKIEEAGDYYHVHFNDEKIIFLKRDLKILPVTNITVEELSNYLLAQLLLDKTELEKNKIQKIKIKVFSGPGLCGSSTWRRSDD
jgi:6-pyruvoyltetrahydropterin/6-carboxytetrahydropterin synthase